MKLEERLDQALAKHRLVTHEQAPEIKEQPSHPKSTTKTDYETVAEGLEHLDDHQLDEDGIGCFTAKDGLEKVQLPMTVGDYVVEDIQRVKTGEYQVHFSKSGTD